MLRSLPRCTQSGLLFAAAVLAGAQPASAAGSPTVVISQVYGGGGNAGAPFQNDFVELFNRGATAVSLDGSSIQYASATGTATFGGNPRVALSGSLAPGQYYLVQLAGGSNGAPLPTPDALGAIAMSAGAGKVVLASTTEGLPCNGGSNPCGAADLARIVDLVGYGAANFFEGAGPAPALSNTTAALRLGEGATDTDDNASDFSAGAPNPRNSSVGVGDIEGLGDAKVWVGLRNSDAVGLRVDLLAEVLVDETVAGAGRLDNVRTGSSGFNNAILHTIPLDLDVGPLGAAGPLGLRVSVRRTCSGPGHNSGGVRLWYGGQPVYGGAGRDAGSRFDATVDGAQTEHFLRSGFRLEADAGTSRAWVDVFVDSKATCPGRPFKAFGTWRMSPP